MRFEGKRVVVTGGANGFGKAICEGFAREGAKVMVTDIDGEAAAELAGGLEGALSFPLDVGEEEPHAELAQRMADEWGGIDVVATNAGLPHRGGYLTRVSTEDFDRMWTINVRSVYFAAKYFTPHMGEGSSITSTASIGGRRPRVGLTPYNASKAAVITLTKGLAAELAPKIRVNCVAPVSAPTGFDLVAGGGVELSEEVNQRVIAGIPMGRRAVPTDVANAIMFLASDEAEFLTGVCLDVDGGRSIS